jgi:hypothetical protein
MKKIFYSISLVILAFLLNRCSWLSFGFEPNAREDVEVYIASVDNNVCKKLLGDVVIYAVFVDTKETKPWSEYDIRSTIDSIYKAAQWISTKAKENDKYVTIELHFPQHNQKIPIEQDLPKKTLSATMYQGNMGQGIKLLGKWADKIAVMVAKNLPPDTSKIIASKNKLGDKERLIARLRDIYKTDNVALIYFLNNYYQYETSVTMNTNSYKEIEYSIVSFKDPSVIAHEFLHLFGAWDLYITPYEKSKKDEAKKKLIMKEFPNEIMAFSYRSLDSLDISPFTKYCIGWEKQLDKHSAELVLGKNIKPLKY